VTTLAPLEHAPELAPHAASAGSGSLADTLFRIMLHKHFGISDYLEQVNQPLPWDVDSRNSRRKDPQGIKEVLLVTRAGKKHVVGPNELEVSSRPFGRKERSKRAIRERARCW